mgnify:FL=1
MFLPWKSEATKNLVVDSARKRHFDQVIHLVDYVYGDIYPKAGVYFKNTIYSNVRSYDWTLTHQGVLSTTYIALLGGAPVGAIIFKPEVKGRLGLDFIGSFDRFNPDGHIDHELIRFVDDFADECGWRQIFCHVPIASQPMINLMLASGYNITSIIRNNRKSQLFRVGVAECLMEKTVPTRHQPFIQG